MPILARNAQAVDVVVQCITAVSRVLDSVQGVQGAKRTKVLGLLRVKRVRQQMHVQVKLCLYHQFSGRMGSAMGIALWQGRFVSELGLTSLMYQLVQVVICIHITQDQR